MRLSPMLTVSDVSIRAGRSTEAMSEQWGTPDVPPFEPVPAEIMWAAGWKADQRRDDVGRLYGQLALDEQREVGW